MSYSTNTLSFYPRAAKRPERCKGLWGVTIRVEALLTPRRRRDQGRYKVLGWVQGMSLHVWVEKKLKNVDLDHRSNGVAKPCITNTAATALYSRVAEKITKESEWRRYEDRGQDKCGSGAMPHAEQCIERPSG